MHSFGFTQKKFTRLTGPGRHRHLAAWLTANFQALRTGRVCPDQWKQLLREYSTILSWAGLDLPKPCPGGQDIPACLAWLSDAIHFHRIAAGMVIRDPDMAQTMITGDRAVSAPPPPAMTFQVALDGLRSLFNIGSILRSCEAAGIKTVILGNCPGSEDPRVAKTAMGARVSEEKTEDLAAVLAEKKAEGFTLIGVDTLEGSRPCHELDWPARAVVVLGNEEYGIAPHLLPVMDHCVHIPMFGAKNSLNVANAASIILFQAVFSFIS
jgi:tRNA(Leu) C34 or U34 (ribose-2'-O)-methylase TrmL